MLWKIVEYICIFKKNVVVTLPLHAQLTSMVIYAPYAPSQSLQLAGQSLSVATNSSRKLRGGASFIQSLPLTFGVSSLYTLGRLAHLLFNKWFQKNLSFWLYTCFWLLILYTLCLLQCFYFDTICFGVFL